MKPFWEMTQEDMDACLAATDWCRANYEYFRGGGFSSHFRCKAQMPVTMLRVNIIDGIGPVIQIAEGHTVDLPDEIHRIIDKRTDPRGRRRGLSLNSRDREHSRMSTVSWQTGGQIMA